MKKNNIIFSTKSDEVIFYLIPKKKQFTKKNRHQQKRTDTNLKRSKIMDWTKEQSQAISKNKSNILVAAAAGSGKTAVLVERIINKILNEKIDIDKLLVVT